MHLLNVSTELIEKMFFDAYLFLSIQEVQAITEDWLVEYNAVRPHDALGGLPPYQVTAANVQKVST